MNIHFVASDLHLGHRNIMKYCPGRCNPRTDPEDITEYDIQHMNERIIANWNSVIDPDQGVIIIGDVAMGVIEKAPALIRRLNGTKYLVAGNHDRTLRKLIDSTPELGDLFGWVESYHEMTYKYGGEKHLLCMSHFPMTHWHRQGTGSIMLHGHLHSPGDRLHIAPGRIMDMGIDGNNLFPRRIEDVIKICLKRPVGGNHHDL